MNKALKWYNNLKVGDKIGTFKVEEDCCGNPLNQEALEEYINKRDCSTSASLWELAEEQLFNLEKEYGSNGAISLFKGNAHYKPYRPLRKTENLLMCEKDAPHCLHEKCGCNVYGKGCSFEKCTMSWTVAGCLVNELCNILITFYIGGWSGIKEEKENNKNLDPELFRYIKRKFSKKYIGVEENLLYNKKIIDSIFQNEEDLIVISEEEYKERKPYFMDKWEIMNMLEDKARYSDVFKIAENHYKIIFGGEDKDCKEYHFICPISADRKVEHWWKEIRWILNNLFITNFEKERRLFY